MEYMAFCRGLESISRNDIQMDTFVSDRHSTIAKHLREKLPNVTHFFDLWHLVKSKFQRPVDWTCLANSYIFALSNASHCCHVYLCRDYEGLKQNCKGKRLWDTSSMDKTMCEPPLLECNNHPGWKWEGYLGKVWIVSATHCKYPLWSAKSTF